MNELVLGKALAMYEYNLFSYLNSHYMDRLEIFINHQETKAKRREMTRILALFDDEDSLGIGFFTEKHDMIGKAEEKAKTIPNMPNRATRGSCKRPIVYIG